MNNKIFLNQKGQTRLWIAIVIIVVFLVAIGLFTVLYKKPAEEITIGYSALSISLPVFVAQEKGYFTEEGLNIKLERFDTAQPLMTSLIAGNVKLDVQVASSWGKT